MLIANRSNWHRVITIIWGFIDREIRLVLKALEDHENLADFMKRVEQAKYLIASFARDPAFGRTPYALRGRESYPSRPAYIECSRNSQPFQRHNDKAYNVRFSSYTHGKDVDGKGKGIDRTNQNKPWEAGRDVNKDACAYAMYSDDEDSYVSQPFLSVCFQASADEVYFVRDSIRSFDSGHCKFGCGKTFRSLEAKTAHESNKTCIRAAKLEARQYAQTAVNRMCRICSVEFSS